MSGRRLKINLPGLEKKSDSSIERPSSRTDQLVEASFSSDLSPLIGRPQHKSSNSLVTMPSISKLKEVLARTSEKLKGYTGKPDSLSAFNDSPCKIKEIAELKQRIKDLEAEK